MVERWRSTVAYFEQPAAPVPDEYDHLSELFYTGEVQGRFPTGVGLGLHVTRQLLEYQGGLLEVRRPTPDDDTLGFELSVPFAPISSGHELESRSVDSSAVADANKADAHRRIQ